MAEANGDERRSGDQLDRIEARLDRMEEKLDKLARITITSQA